MHGHTHTHDIASRFWYQRGTFEIAAKSSITHCFGRMGYPFTARDPVARDVGAQPRRRGSVGAAALLRHGRLPGQPGAM